MSNEIQTDGGLHGDPPVAPVTGSEVLCEPDRPGVWEFRATPAQEWLKVMVSPDGGGVALRCDWPPMDNTNAEAHRRFHGQWRLVEQAGPPNTGGQPAGPTEGQSMSTEKPIQEAAGVAAATGSAAPDWKEATDAAEAWCQITDQEGRAHAIYCYRAGYLKAKRQNNGTQRPGDAEATNATRADAPGSLE